MQVSEFEKCCPAVNNAEIVADKMDALVELLKNAEKPMTCKEIGIALYGEDYLILPDCYENWMHNMIAREHIGHLGYLLSQLSGNGYIFVKVEKTNIPVTDKKGNIVTYRTQELKPSEEPTEPYMITVKDEQGRTYSIRNPHYVPRPALYETVTKVVFQKIKYYEWKRVGK